MKSNLRIEFKTERNTERGLYRLVYWRIVPSELGLFRRLFLNPWHQAYYYRDGSSTDLFDPGEFKSLKESCKTVGDIKDRDLKFTKYQNSLWEA